MICQFMRANISKSGESDSLIRPSLGYTTSIEHTERSFWHSNTLLLMRVEFCSFWNKFKLIFFPAQNLHVAIQQRYSKASREAGFCRAQPRVKQNNPTTLIFQTRMCLWVWGTFGRVPQKESEGSACVCVFVWVCLCVCVCARARICIKLYM